MTDFVKLCRNEASETFYAPLKETWTLVGDRIEKLEAALRELSDGWPCCSVSQTMRDIAREALEGKDG